MNKIVARNRFHIFWVLALFAFLPCASAQSVWDITSSVLDTGQSYDLYSFSSFGFHCIACGVHEDLAHFRSWVTFLESENGGQTWQEVNPGITIGAHATLILRIVEQFDINNIVAVGDSGFIERSKDGGKTWVRQTSTALGRIMDVHFSDSLTGIIAVADSIGVYTTSDGGNHWNTTPLQAHYLWNCYSYGEGKFRAFKYGAGPIYTTTDNWATVDSTDMIFNPRDDTIGNLYALCNFSGGDTMIVQGRDRDGWGILNRSTNAGISWAGAVHFTNIIGSISCMSSLRNDSLLAGGSLFGQTILFSSDNGITWNQDTLIFNSSYTTAEVSGLDFEPDGSAIGIFTSPSFGDGVIARRPLLNEVVKGHLSISNVPEIYPNPAYLFLTITSFESGELIQVLDVLGRKVMDGVMPSNGPLTLDISHLRSGLYYVVAGGVRAKFVKE